MVVVFAYPVNVLHRRAHLHVLSSRASHTAMSTATRVRRRICLHRRRRVIRGRHRSPIRNARSRRSRILRHLAQRIDDSQSLALPCCVVLVHPVFHLRRDTYSAHLMVDFHSVTEIGEHEFGFLFGREMVRDFEDVVEAFPDARGFFSHRVGVDFDHEEEGAVVLVEGAAV